MDFCTALTIIFANSNVTTQGMANYIGYDASYISKWKSGKSAPSPKSYDTVIRKMCEYIFLECGDRNISRVFSALHERAPEGNENRMFALQKFLENCPEEILKAAHTIENSLAEEMGIKCVIGISTNARHLRELADRYKEAQVAIEVGRVFESEKTIINYETLGLGRIIYQLPTTLCEMFLNEVFKKNPIETLDEDTLETINKFFENNLNVSETSRKLYVHRNTLVYRLEKIKKITGLDLREFDHAIVFKVAMMVKMYLDSLNNSKF